VKLWDEIYSEIRSYFGNPDKYIEANNIIIRLEGSVLFELLKRAAEEKNAHTSKRMRDLVARGEHPWQQPEFINAHSERTSKRMRDLVARGKHSFQQPENGKRIRKGKHDKRKLSSGSTEEATYYAIDGADENGRYILIPEIFGTNDLTFRKKVRRRNGKRTTTQFHTMEAIDELYLRKCSTKTCTNRKCRPYMICKTCLGYD
jgi:hypothetical protein